MNRIPIADWAAQAPWDGISNKPSWAGTSGPLVDLSGVTWNGVSADRFPVWNGLKFVPTVISSAPGGSGTTIKDGDQPARAVRRRPPGNPSGGFENIWKRDVFDVKLYGATGAGTDDIAAINAAIFDLNQAGMGVLYFPAGRYVCSSPPDTIAAFALVKGDGIGASTLAFSNGDGLRFDSGGLDLWFGAEGFAVEQTANALKFIGGSVRVRSLAIACSEAGLSIGTPSSPVQAGVVADCFFDFTGTAGGRAVDAYGNHLEMAGIQILSTGLPWDEGVSIHHGSNESLHDLYIENCLNEAILFGTSVIESRIHDIAFKGIGGANAVLASGINNYVNELFGLGGNTDTAFDARKELAVTFAWAPGSIPSGYGFYDDFTVPGASLGDQCVLGVPYSFYEGVSTDLRVVGSNTVRATVFNLGTATVSLPLDDWKMRIFN